ncbi:tetratricopeptide repeat protein [Roseivirga sp.]|uniref:tetratricopeptide repeat protein n=1 Tax=Roseivirga sp. TaxID=1964215 RepID=UPI003B8ABF22
MKRSIIYISLVLLSTSGIAQNLQEAIKLYNNGESKSAKGILQEVKSRSADYEEAQYYLGRIAFDADDYSKAIDHFKTIIKRNDQNSDYFTWLGNAYGVYAQNSSKIRQGFIAPKIRKNYEKAIAIDPQNLDAQKGLIQYYTQAPSFMGGSVDKALVTANTIKSFNEKEGYLALSTVYQKKEEYGKAEEALIKLVSLDSRYATSLGTFYQNQKMYDKAFKHFVALQVAQPENTNALYQFGRTSALSGEKTELGIQSLERYLTLPIQEGAPSYAAAKMRLGMIYEKMGNKPKAKKYYNDSLKDDPKMQLAKEGLKRIK